MVLDAGWRTELRPRTCAEEGCRAVAAAYTRSVNLPEDGGRAVAGAVRAVDALGRAVGPLTTDFPAALAAGDAQRRGYFRPAEEEALFAWFARFLTVREGLWEVLGEVSSPVEGRVERIVDRIGWRCFVLGYSAACLIVELDRFLVEHAAVDPLVQRKLNEGSVAHRIPRKQFTAVFNSFTDPRKALLLESAMRHAVRHRELLAAMAEDPVVGVVAADLAARERVLDPSRRRYGGRLLAYLRHAFRRRGASARQQALFGILELSGRAVSEVRDTWTPPRLVGPLQQVLAGIVRPGDVLVTRHERALTNLFLPGYWPHAALYVGSEADRVRLGIALDPARAARWSGSRRVLEALKDGVLFRPLDQTLAVDAVAVIRPLLSAADVAVGIARAATHEGKCYNFDFDFFRSDCLVCTEVVYRAYDGLGGLELPLFERSGRPTLSAEDLLRLAVAGRGFEPVAVVGAPGCQDRVVAGAAAGAILADSLEYSPT